MIATLKVPLYPAKEQIDMFNKMADAYHKLQNMAVEYLKNCEHFVSESELRCYLVDNSDKSLSLSFVSTVISKEKQKAYTKYGSHRLKFYKYSVTRKAFPVRCDSNCNRVSRI